MSIEVFKLRPEQELIVAALTKEYKSGIKRLILKAGCSAGKTVIAATLIKRALEKGKRVGMIFPRLSILEQTIALYTSFGFEFGVIQANHRLRDMSQQLQLISAQTFILSDPEYFDLVVIDEGHRQYDTLNEYILARPNLYVLGLTATPFSKGLGLVYEKCIEPVPVAELVRLGSILDPDYYDMETVGRDGLEESRGEFTVSSVTNRVNTKEIVGSVIDTWLKLGGNKPTFIYAASIAHSQYLIERFIAKGVNAVHVDYNTSKDDKAHAIEMFRTGYIKVLSSVELLSEGVDAPCLEVIILAGHVKSLSRHIQMLGRCTRNYTPLTDALESIGYSGVLVVHPQYSMATLRSCLLEHEDYNKSWDNDLILMDRSKAADCDFTGVSVAHDVLPNKGTPIVIDHVGNVMTLGGVSDPTSTELSCNSKTDPVQPIGSDKLCAEYSSEIRMYPCPSCYVLMPASTYKCTKCGTVDRKANRVKEIPGIAKRLDMKRIEVTKAAKPSAGEKMLAYRNMIWYGRSQGYVRGWADHKYRREFAVWPNVKKGIEPLEPDQSATDKYNLK